MRRFLATILVLALALAPARAQIIPVQFNGWNGIYALNHMSFGVMNQPLPAVVSGGSGYTVSDVLVMDCLPDIYVIGVRPTATVTSISGSGAVTGISLTTPGFATKLPSTGLAGEPNGVCTFNTTGGTGTGATIYAVFGFNAAMVNGSNSSGGGGLTPIPPDTVLGNITGITAIPQPIPVPPCDTADNALTYTAGSGFGCNSLPTLTITDGSTTVADVTQIAFVGATISGTTPNGIVTISALSADPCMGSVRSNAAFSTAGATNIQVIAPVAAEKIYICSLSLVAGSTAHFSIIEGTGAACTTTNTAAVIGSTTAANGMAIVINGGVTYGGGGTIGVTATTANGICVLVDASVQFAGNMTYVQQ